MTNNEEIYIKYLAEQQSAEKHSEDKAITTDTEGLYDDCSLEIYEVPTNMATTSTTAKSDSKAMLCTSSFYNKFRKKITKSAEKKMSKANIVPLSYKLKYESRLTDRGHLWTELEGEVEEVAAWDLDGDELYVNDFDYNYATRRKRAIHGRPFESSIGLQPTESADPRPPLDWPEPPPPPPHDI